MPAQEQRLTPAGAETPGEASYRTLFEANPEAVLVWCDGKMVLVNPACVRLLGYTSAAEMLGLPLAAFIDPDYLQPSRERLRQVIEGRAPVPPLGITLLRRDARPVEVEGTALPTEFEGRPAALAIMRDLTAERAAAHRVRRLSALRLAQSRTNEAIFRIAEPGELARAVCAIAIEHEDVTSSIVRLADREHGVLEVLAVAGARLGSIGVAQVGIDDPRSSIARVLRECRAQVDNDIETRSWGNADAEARRLGLRSRAIFPLIDGGGCIGVFSLLSTEAGFFDDELTGLLEEMANNLATALAKRRAEAALARSSEYFGQLYTNMPQGVRIICEGRVVLVNPAAERLFGIAAAQMLGQPAWVGIAPQSRAWADARLHTVIETRQPAPLTEAMLLRPDGTAVEIESAMLPVEYEGKPAAMAVIHDLTAHKAAARRVARLTSLYAGLSKTNEAILRVPGHLELCQAVCEIAATHGGLVSAAIRIYDPLSGMLEPYCGHGTLHGNFGLTAIPLDHPYSNASRTARELTHHVCNDIATDADALRTRADAEAIGVRAFATFALTTDGELTGVLSVYAPETGFFDDELTALLREMADNLCFAFSKRRAEAALGQSEERYRALFDASPDAIRVICDERVVMVNPACVRLLGCASTEEALAQPFYGTIEPAYHERVRERMHRVIHQHLAVPPAQQVMLRADRTPVMVEAATLPMQYQGRPAAMSILRDLTEKKAAERREARLSDFYIALSRTNETIFRESDLPTLCRKVCELAVTHGGLLLAGIRVPDAAGTSLVHYCHAGMPAGPIGVSPVSLEDTRHPAIRAWRDAGHCVVNDLLQNPPSPAEHLMARAGGARAGAAFALTIEGRSVGLLSVFAAEPGFFDTELTGLIDELARNLSFAFARARNSAALTASEDRYRDLFDASPDAIRVVCDERVVLVNPAGVRLFGLASAAEMLGRPLAETIAPEFRAEALERVRAVAEERRAVPLVEQALVRADGSRVDVEVVTLPFEYAGRPAALSILHDLTARKAVERATQRLNAELEGRVARRTAQLKQANADLESFSYTVAHDLRAPLRRMSGFASLLKEALAGAPEGDRAFVARIVDGAASMDRLIDGMLEVARLGRAELKPQPLDLSAKVRAIAEGLCAREPGRAVEFVIAPGLTARGDSRLVRALLDNLLGNAWKFTSAHASAKIEFGMLPQAPDPADATTMHTFYVRDDGAGFDPQYMGKLFSQFQRLHTQSEFAGTGIGLASVKRIITNHGGAVWAEGAVERGATFYFTLPAAD